MRLLFCFCIATSLNAQLNTDSNYISIDSLPIGITNPSDFFSLTPRVNYLNTTIKEFQNYNPIFKNGIINTSLGNIGSVSQAFSYNINFAPDSKPLPNPSEYLEINHDSPIYTTLTPYTEINYFRGSKNEQYLSTKHIQNIKNLISIGLQYNSITSPGYFTRQASKVNNFNFFTNFYGIKNYKAYLNAYLNVINNQENGGIAPNAKQDFEIDNIKTLSTNLNTAYNYKFSNGIALNQVYNNKHYLIGLASGYRFNRFVYEDASYSTNSFYQTNFDTTKLSERQYSQVWFNKLHASILLYSDSLQHKNLSLNGSLLTEWVHTFKRDTLIVNNLISNLFGNKYSYNHRYINNLVSGNIHYESSTITTNLSASYFISGYNKGDNNIKGEIAYQRNNFKINTTLDLVNQKPALFYNSFISNNFLWTNNFKQSNSIAIHLNSFYGNWLGLGGAVYNTKNAVILDSLNTPKLGNIMVLKLWLNANIFSKYFNLENKLVIQNINTGKELINLPKIQIYSSLYKNLIVFKNRTPVAIGFDFRYFSSFNANLYSPSSNSFYFNTQNSIGNYLSSDFFLIFKVKRFRFLIKLENWGSDLFTKRYYVQPNNPMNPRTLKLGFSWKFYD